MRGVVFCLVILVCTSHVYGFSIFGGRQDCLCRAWSHRFHIRLVKRVELYPQTVRCEKVEIVVTLHNKQRRCVNPDSRWAQRYMRMLLKLRYGQKMKM
ncbi:C-X-C motif chemokine 11-like [Megalops cyprinoides]|uniref:C-X-C motif chemokine 11-like n=1 Tax=Megalops cyprinoides TaxID=118141 RepID=UPI001863DE5E|nr:C-X-C motif chemokine 11-like [Megalops cyprinoides]